MALVGRVFRNGRRRVEERVKGGMRTQQIRDDIQRCGERERDLDQPLPHRIAIASPHALGSPAMIRVERPGEQKGNDGDAQHHSPINQHIAQHHAGKAPEEDDE